jgi:hypothetical protein
MQLVHGSVRLQHDVNHARCDAIISSPNRALIELASFPPSYKAQVHQPFPLHALAFGNLSSD